MTKKTLLLACAMLLSACAGTTTKDGLVYRATSFFAPTLESPDWRRNWVERLPEGSGD